MLFNNVCEDNGWHGIATTSSGHSTISSNACIANADKGIFIHLGGNTTVVNNTCSRNIVIGLSLSDSNFVIVLNNKRKILITVKFYSNGRLIRIDSAGGNRIHTALSGFSILLNPP